MNPPRYVRNSAIGARYGYILSPFLRLVPAMGIFSPFLRLVREAAERSAGHRLSVTVELIIVGSLSRLRPLTRLLLASYAPLTRLLRASYSGGGFLVLNLSGDSGHHPGGAQVRAHVPEPYAAPRPAEAALDRIEYSLSSSAIVIRYGFILSPFL
eukprot:1180318-Prorocentrum_minimum.AAC.1